MNLIEMKNVLVLGKLFILVKIGQTTRELINNKGYMISIEGDIYIGSFLVNKELVNLKKRREFHKKEINIMDS